jgi:predicted ester cyclase
LKLKKLFSQWQQSFDESALSFSKAINDLAPNTTVDMCHPFGQIQGAKQLFEQAYLPLFKAMKDIERRDLIVMSGTTEKGQHWLGTMGNYMGTFTTPFLNIPPTGHLAYMRYHEFFRFEDGKIIEIQAIWDIPELMMQANAWPMAPQLGTSLCTPAPMSGDGLSIEGDGGKSLECVTKMIENLCLHPNNPDPKIMQLKNHWSPKMNWYGPTGIGGMRGIAGFRHWHQIPFLRAMPDRKLDHNANLESHWISEGDYVCETGWPNMRLTLKNDGWMGIAPNNQEVLLRSLDFWRVENGKIRENWVLIDLLDLYMQIGVDVLARLDEFNKVKNLNKMQLEEDY